MTDCLISVIIPVYRTEKNLLKKCIRSVLHQTYKKYECIIVDDGNDSAYAEFLDDYSQTDNRIKIFHKKNGGLGSARNHGILNAQGEYVFFLDSDDYLSPFAFENAVKIADSDCDLVVGGMKHVDANKDIKFEKIINRLITIENKNEKKDYILHLSGMRKKAFALKEYSTADSACAKLIKRSLALSCMFVNDKYWDEDTLWSISLVDKCKKIIIVDNLWYAYVMNSASMVRSYKGDRTIEYQVRAKQEYDIIKKLWPQSIQGAYHLIWHGLFRYCRTDVFHKNNPNNSRKKFDDFCHAIDFSEFKEMVYKIKFDDETRLIYKMIKKLIIKLFQKNMIKECFIILKICNRYIQY